MTAEWRAGAVSLEFPVPAGAPMGGYAARSGGAEGTLDPLTITALWLENGTGALAIVSADLVGVDEALTARIAKQAGIARESLLLAASHTHSGPAGLAHKLHVTNEEQVDHRLRGRFVDWCAEAISAAQSKAQPATVRLGRSPITGLCGNRNNPGDTARESELVLVDVVAVSGAPVASIVHWSCHPTVLGAANRLISADFPGALRRELQSIVGTPAYPVLYLNGAAGDLSTRFTRRGQDAREVERIGRDLASAVVEARTDVVELQPLLRHARSSLTLRGWTDDEINSILYEKVINLADQAGDRRAETQEQGRELLEALAASPCRPRRRTIRLDAWQLGHATLIAVPGELFSSLGEDIRRSADSEVIAIGYAGGYAGYLPARAAYDARTYEALASPFGPGCGERVVEAAVEMVKALQATGDKAE